MSNTLAQVLTLVLLCVNCSICNKISHLLDGKNSKAERIIKTSVIASFLSLAGLSTINLIKCLKGIDKVFNNFSKMLLNNL